MTLYPMLALSDAVWMAIISGVVTLGLAWMAKRKLDGIQKAVNGNLSAAMEGKAISARALAAVTHDPKHITIAEVAEKAYADHQTQIEKAK